MLALLLPNIASSFSLFFIPFLQGFDNGSANIQGGRNKIKGANKKIKEYWNRELKIYKTNWKKSMDINGLNDRLKALDFKALTVLGMVLHHIQMDLFDKLED